jgi:hypothetical protein
LSIPFSSFKIFFEDDVISQVVILTVGISKEQMQSYIFFPDFHNLVHLLWAGISPSAHQIRLY